MLAILTNSFIFCPENKLVTKKYGTGEIPSKILSNMSIFVGVQTITIAK